MKKLLRYFSKLPINKSGQVMIVGLVVLMVVLILSASLFNSTSLFIGFFSRSVLNEQATQLAEAGLDYAVQKLNDTAGNYLSQPGTTETRTLSTGEVVIKIDVKTQNLKTITATGYVPNISSPRAIRTVKVDTLIDTQQISFQYAVQVGIGGVNMENSSTINGTVYSNKSGSNSIQGSGSSQINGDAWAVGTISTPDPLVTGAKHSPASPIPMPTFDYQKWENASTELGVTNCSGTCTWNSGSPLLKGKYIGNLDLTNTATAIMDGAMWVTGSVTVKNSAKLNLNNSYGSNGSVLLTGDRVNGTGGKVMTENSGGFNPTDANPKGYILVVSTSSADDAINVKNSGVNAVFYALNGGAALENTAKVTALVANKLTTKNSASLTYDLGLAGANFVSTTGGSWQVKKGTYYASATPIYDLVAVYDATLKAPVCATIGISCTANVQGVKTSETNQPNTISQCPEFGGDPIQMLKVKTDDQTAFAKGKSVTFEVTVDNWNDGGESFIDFWYTPKSVNSGWVYKGSVEFAGYDGPPDYGANLTRSVTFNLDNIAGLHTVHANYRDHNYTGPPPIPHCTYGDGYSYDDHDDVVFMVGN